jgi:hypothetical protein
VFTAELLMQLSDKCALLTTVAAAGMFSLSALCSTMLGWRQSGQQQRICA